MSFYLVQGKLGGGKGKYVMGKIEEALREGRRVDEPGRYTLHPSSFYVGKFSSLEMSARLVPVAAK